MKNAPSPVHRENIRIYGNEFDRKTDYTTKREKGRKDWLLIYTLTGAGIIRCQGMDKTIVPGSLLLYEPGAYQDYATALVPGRWHFLWLHFHAPVRLRRLTDWPQWKPGIRLAAVPEGGLCLDVISALRRAIRFGGRAGDPGERLALLALEELFLLLRTEKERGKDAIRDPRIEKALEHLRSHYKEPFALKTLARLAGLSVSRFSFLFRQQTGRTAQDFLEQCRMEHAASLLDLTQLNVSETAAECGYEDPLYFSKRFKMFYGNSPGKWLRRLRA